MKYLTQFMRITAFTLVGEWLQRMIPLPIPASVYGLVLLFAALCAGVVKPEQVKDEDMPLVARQIAQKIESELEYPGQIKVSIIRENRATDYAK